MISFDHSPNPIHHHHEINPSKNKNKNKRSLEDLMTESEDQIMIQYHNSSKAKTMKWAASFDTDLHLQSPSPNYSDQQCHFKLGKNYCHDQMTHMNLDLELNLPCGTSKKSPRRSSGVNQVEVAEGDQKEMVAAACRRCHMLVMMCKASPACPNCKFIHPPDLTQPGLFTKPRRSTWLLC